MNKDTKSKISFCFTVYAALFVTCRAFNTSPIRNYMYVKNFKNSNGTFVRTIKKKLQEK